MSQNTLSTELEQWRNAYLRQRRHAVVGRLFRGVLHNVNGVLQAMSMQAELLAFGAERAVVMLAEEQGKEEEALREQLARHQQLAAQIIDQVQAVREIVALGDPLEEEGGEGSELSAVVRQVVRFMTADRFFKHQVEREIRVEDGVRPALDAKSLGFILLVLVENAIEAMDADGRGWLAVRARQDQGMVELVVEDSGPDPGVLDEERLFAPFVSSKPGHDGLGLYLARRLIVAAGGSIVFQRKGDPGKTQAVVLLPSA